MSREDFAAKLKEEMNGFIYNCGVNARKLSSYLHERCSLGYTRDPKPVTIDQVKEVVKSAADKISTIAEKTLGHTTAMLAITGDTLATTKRIDNRTRKLAKERRIKRTYTIEVQDKAYTLWESGRKNPSVKEGSNRKPTREQVFSFYHKDFLALGIETDRICQGKHYGGGDVIHFRRGAVSAPYRWGHNHYPTGHAGYLPTEGRFAKRSRYRAVRVHPGGYCPPLHG